MELEYAKEYRIVSYLYTRRKITENENKNI